MGFGFNLFCLFVLLPISAILLILAVISKKGSPLKLLGYVWLGVIGMIILSVIVRFFTEKKALEKEDYYGSYIINRKFFPGEQADWQYNTFRFEIKENDSIYFYITDKAKILDTLKGVVHTTDPTMHFTPRLKIEMEEPGHHILSSNPTTYRRVWDFYLVFRSPEFYNVCFEQGLWQPID